MKLINRSKSKLPINWKSSTINSKDIENTAFRYRDLIIKNGTKAFNIINDELKLPNLKSFKVRAAEINKSENSVSDDLKKAILNSSNNIKLICEEERKKLSSSSIETTKGITLWKEFRSIETVGLYVPGGSAPLISSFVGSTFDTFIFFLISFYGTGVPWISLSLGDLSVKILVALFMLIPFRLLLGTFKAA